MSATVQCPECGEEHKVKDVEFIDVSEDMQGRDLYKYRCPKTGNVTEALVRAPRGGRW